MGKQHPRKFNACTHIIKCLRFNDGTFKVLMSGSHTHRASSRTRHHLDLHTIWSHELVFAEFNLSWKLNFRGTVVKFSWGLIHENLILPTKISPTKHHSCENVCIYNNFALLYAQHTHVISTINPPPQSIGDGPNCAHTQTLLDLFQIHCLRTINVCACSWKGLHYMGKRTGQPVNLDIHVQYTNLSADAGRGQGVTKINSATTHVNMATLKHWPPI